MDKTQTDIDPLASKASQILAMQIVLELITNKWSLMILAELCSGAQRFNALKRLLGKRITHKALAEALKRLERSGIIRRTVPTRPRLSVTYSLTALAHTLEGPFRGMQEWAVLHLAEIEGAQAAFDRENSPE